MGETFRGAMTWLHTWSGVVLGGVLFAIFWMGTLSVVDREIDRWMMPSTRLARPATLASLDALHSFYQAAVEARSPIWLLALPTERDPVFRMTWHESGRTIVRLADPSSGRALAGPQTLAGTGFLYPFHYMLHIRWATGWSAQHRWPCSSCASPAWSSIARSSPSSLPCAPTGGRGA